MRALSPAELRESQSQLELEASGCAVPGASVRRVEDVATTQRLNRLKRLIREHHDLVWRTLRRLGVPERDVEDATQRVFLIVGTKLDRIEFEQERSFVFGVAMRISSEVRRSQRRHPEELVAEHTDESDPRPGPEALLQREEMLALLGAVLKRLPEEQRAVFMLHEFEDLSLNEIARMLEIPGGTAASRLRRARLAFEHLVSEHRQSDELEDR